MERALEQVSTAVRFRKGPYYVLKYGGQYGPGQRMVAEKERRLGRFFDLDIWSSVIHARILLDRTAALSRLFLTGRRLPSFTSFSDHKNFLAKGAHEIDPGYANHVADKTDWFDVPLKLIRDKFIIHAGPKHRRIDTIPWQGVDLVINFIPIGKDESQSGEAWVQLNVLVLSHQVEEFLAWFAAYGVQALERRGS
jgi:hypothetical protein